MKIKALVSFVGAVSMQQGEVREVSDELAKDLIKAKHAKKVTATKGGDEDESQ